VRSVSKAFALLGSLALSGLVVTPPVKAADIAPVVEEPAGLGWYVSIFGGPKWGDGDVHVKDIRREDECAPERITSPICQVSILQIGESHEADLHGEVDNGFLIGGAIGAQISDNFRAELEVSHARLDTKTEVEDYVLYEPTLGQNYSAKDDDDLRELFIMANIWFGFQMSSVFSPYVGGGVGVAHVDANFGVGEFQVGVPPIRSPLRSKPTAGTSPISSVRGS
jgi:opacity protein-like surface antigen